MKASTTVFRLAVVASLVASAIPATSAQFTPGDLVVYRVGTGAGSLGSAAAAVFFDEYNLLGTRLQSVALPSTGASALTAVGNDTTEGILSMSQDGTKLVFTGYRADAGTANPSASDPATVNRVIGTIGLGATPDTSVALTDPNGTIRSATSTDASSLFYAGTSTGLRYVASPSGASTTTLIDSRNTRETLVRGNTLFGSSTLAGNTSKILSYGNLPVGATVGTPAVVQGITDTINGYAMFDLSPIVAGPDTIYALSTVQNKLYKYTYNGTSWASSGSMGASGALNIGGVSTNGSSVNLFLTSASTLFSEYDASGYNATISGTLTTLATAGANTAFRGVALIPEPSTISLGLLAAGTLLALRRRRS
ncbi:MAG: PEP-CTERM sorting domain-containing protein [Verrucomicrobiota bacterium]